MHASLTVVTHPARRALHALRTARRRPVAAMIHGLVKPRHMLRFVRDNARVGAQLATAPAYLFAAGAHRDAYRIDRAEGRHSTEFWVRFRPLRSEGTFEGRDPFAGALRATGVPAPSAALPTATPASSVPA